MSDGKQMQADLLAQLERKLAAANARVQQLESTLAACREALKRVQAGFPSRSMDGGWGGSGDPAYADQVNKAIDSAVARVEGSDAF